jgi:hypothetical protein
VPHAFGVVNLKATCVKNKLKGYLFVGQAVNGSRLKSAWLKSVGESLSKGFLAHYVEALIGMQLSSRVTKVFSSWSTAGLIIC